MSLALAARMNALGTETAFEVLARAEGARAEGQADHQPRHRPAGLPHARRTSSRPRSRRCATATTAIRRRPASRRCARRSRADIAPARRRRVAGPRARRAGRQGDDVLRDPHVRRARRGDPLSEPRLSDLRVVIKFTGAKPVPIPLLEEKGFSFDADEVLVADHPSAPSGSIILNSPGEPDRRRHARGPRSTSWSPGLERPPARRHHVGRDLRPDDL
jgi:aspartate aminotransferase